MSVGSSFGEEPDAGAEDPEAFADAMIGAMRRKLRAEITANVRSGRVRGDIRGAIMFDGAGTSERELFRLCIGIRDEVRKLYWSIDTSSATANQIRQPYVVYQYSTFSFLSLPYPRGPVALLFCSLMLVPLPIRAALTVSKVPPNASSSSDLENRSPASLQRPDNLPFKFLPNP